MSANCALIDLMATIVTITPIKDFDQVKVGDDAGAQFDRPGREPAGQVGNRSDQYPDFDGQESYGKSEEAAGD